VTEGVFGHPNYTSFRTPLQSHDQLHGPALCALVAVGLAAVLPSLGGTDAGILLGEAVLQVVQVLLTAAIYHHNAEASRLRHRLKTAQELQSLGAAGALAAAVAAKKAQQLAHVRAWCGVAAWAFSAGTPVRAVLFSSQPLAQWQSIARNKVLSSMIMTFHGVLDQVGGWVAAPP
jgi:hypothetical protein